MKYLNDIEPKTHREMVSRLLAFICFVLGVAYLLDAPIKVDYYLFAFIGLGFLPWLGYFIRRAGSDGVELYTPEPKSVDSSGLKANQPKQESKSALSSWADLSDEGKLVFKTFDYYQRERFGLNGKQRWVFTVPYGQPQHLQFQKGILELHKKGFVSFDHVSMMFGLTDEGVDFANQYNTEIREHLERFHFKA
jgi:hypothetical protein